MTDPAAPTGPRRFQPTFWSSVCALAGVAVLLGLGTWQLQRLGWKENLIDERVSRSQGPAMALPVEISDPGALEFTKVRVTGSFRHDQEMVLHARTNNGNVGFNLVTPFELSDGRSLLVDRGWVPPQLRDPAARAEGQIAGTVELEGLLRTDGWKGADFVKPDNKPAERAYYWIDIPVMAESAGLTNAVREVYLEAGPAKNPGGFPIGGQTRIHLRNDHLQYAITWYALAIILAVIYGVFSYRPLEEKP